MALVRSAVSRASGLSGLVALLATASMGAPAGARTPVERDPVAELSAADPHVRLRAVSLLAGRTDAAAERALALALADPGRPETHFLAAAHLGAISPRSPAANAALAEAWEADDPATRLAAGFAVGLLASGRGALDGRGESRPGQPVIDPEAPVPPLEPPAGLDAASLAGTAWSATGPINILGEGTTTLLFLRATPGGPFRAHLAHGTRHLTRPAPPPGGPRPERRWETSWTFENGWVDADGTLTRLVPVRSGDAAAPDVRIEERRSSLGLLAGRLVTPALRRVAPRRWRGTEDGTTWELVFDRDVAADAKGSVEVTARTPGRGPGGADLVRRMERDWETDASAPHPVLRLLVPLVPGQVLPTNVFPARPTDPFAVTLDVAAGAGAMQLRGAGSVLRFDLLQRPEPQ